MLSSVGSMTAINATRNNSGLQPLTGSIRFNNSNSYAYFGSPINLVSAFTIEFWANIPAAGNGTFQGFWGQDTISVGWDYQGDGKWGILTGGTTWRTSATTSTNAKLGWQHIAAQRSAGGVYTIYVDGVLAFTSGVATGTLSGGSGWVIGRQNWTNNSNYVQNNGSMTGLRISNIVRYSANFTPSTMNVLQDGNAFHTFNFKASNNYLVSENGLSLTNVNSTFQEYRYLIDAAQFNGSALLTATNTYSLGTGPFTYEAWCFVASTNGTAQGFFGLGTTSAFFTILYDDQNSQKWSANQSTGTAKFDGPTGKIGWQHVAITRNETDSRIRIFLDGVLSYTSPSANTTSLDNLAGIVSGRAFVPPSGNIFPVRTGGRISGLRLSNIDRYQTSNFTPSRREFIHDSNTHFIFNFTTGTNWLTSQNGAITLTNTNATSVASGL